MHALNSSLVRLVPVLVGPKAIFHAHNCTVTSDQQRGGRLNLCNILNKLTFL